MLRLRSGLGGIISLLGVAVLLFVSIGLLWYFPARLLSHFDWANLLILGFFCLAALGFIIIVMKLKIKTVYICIGIFLLSFILQFLFSSTHKIVGENDLQFYYANAVKIAEGAFHYNSLYSASFPGTVTYPALLAVFFQFLGIHRIIPALLNQISTSATIVLVFLYVKSRYSTLSGLVCAMLLATNPLVIIYCGTCNAEILYGNCMIWSYVTFCFALKRFESARRIRFFLVPAIFLGVSVLFRPLALLMLIAMLLYLIIISRINYKKCVAICLILLLPFLLCNYLNGLLVKKITTYDAPKSSYGWNLYIGASAAGSWNQADGAEFDSVVAAASSPSEIQTYFAQKAFDRYKGMGFGIVGHSFAKLSRWYAVDYIAQEATLTESPPPQAVNFTQSDYVFPVFLYQVPILLLAMAFFLLLLFRRCFRRDPANDNLIILAFYAIGSFIVFAFLEFAPRYTISYHILFTIPAFEMLLLIYRSLSAKLTKNSRP